MPVDPIAVEDLIVAVDPIALADLIAAVDPNVAADRIAVVDHCVGQVHTAVQIAAVADPIAAGDRDGEAAHIAAQNVAAADLNAAGDHCEAAARIAAPNAVQVDLSALVVRSAVVVLRNAALGRTAVQNVVLNAVQIFPTAQHDRVSLVLLVDPTARNVALRSEEMHCQSGANSLRADDHVKVCHRRRRAAPDEQLVPADYRLFPADVLMVLCRSTKCEALQARADLVDRRRDLLAR